MCYTILKQEVNSLKEEAMFTPKQVGERIKERRIELGLSMPELGKRIGVNKSTIQRSCRRTSYHSRMADGSFQ